MTPEAWEANKIDFPAARNLGRSRVMTPLDARDRFRRVRPRALQISVLSVAR